MSAQRALRAHAVNHSMTKTWKTQRLSEKAVGRMACLEALAARRLSEKAVGFLVVLAFQGRQHARTARPARTCCQPFNDKSMETPTTF